MNSEIQTLKEKDAFLQNRIAYLENILGVINLQSNDAEYVLVTAGGGHRGKSTKLSIIDLKSPTFNCEIKIDMEDYDGLFVNGAGAVLNNETVVICGGQRNIKCIKMSRDSKIWVRSNLAVCSIS